MLDGIQRKELVHGEKIPLAEFLLGSGCVLPRHAQPHELTSYLVGGRVRLSIGDNAHDVRPSDSWCVHGGVAYGADIVEDSVAIEVFSPPRGDYPSQTHHPDRGAGSLRPSLACLTTVSPGRKSSIIPSVSAEQSRWRPWRFSTSMERWPTRSAR